MSSKHQKSSSSNNRWWFVLAAVAVVVALFMAIGRPGSGRPTAPETAAGARPASTRNRAGDPEPSVSDSAGLAPPRATRSSINRAATENGEPAASQFPQVERLLLDESISETQAAQGLLEIVRNSGLSTEERDEALAHGLNLDFGVFGIMATDPALPLPLAQRYFDELANRNELPRQQIEGYLGLMSHHDEELRTQAADQLAFVLEEEDLAEAPADLRRLALEKLEVLKLQPQQVPAGSEPPANGLDPK
jgi:hypothetical protein